ncbi:putative aspartyl protease [Ophiocordyceps polyrhachis-furcata BCC 54312]|uniref:Aspartyl protease n=1 Tax=Ophiocordyceps polyrhachis-furcata BCC 54312 TaxID=1330021 RepID=A0A367L6N2_9HYPO|nr:putative aspartyl protease [Ophiocordyceps polyrhachis-furcata BCC 54312]
MLGILMAALSVAAGAAQAAVAVPAVWNGFGFLFNITVGGQQLTVLSDWTWMSLFVRSGRCMGRYDPVVCVGEAGQTFFDERRSTSFENSTSLAQIRWPMTAFAPNFTVDYGADTVCVGPVCQAKTIFQLSNFPYPTEAIPTVPFGGIYGLAPVTAGLSEASHPAHYQSWRAGKLGPRVGWHSCSALSSTESCLGGEAKLVFGGTDTELYHDTRMQTFAVRNPPWLEDAFYPVRPPRKNYWSAALTGYWIRTKVGESPNFALGRSQGGGGGGDDNSTLALLDEGSEGLGAPLSSRAYAWLTRHVGAMPASKEEVDAISNQGSSGFNTATQKWYTVPCRATDQFPDLIYELEGKANYTVRPRDYVTRLKGRGSCYLNINVWRYGRTEDGDAKVVLLGIMFLKRLYVMLDFESRSFGLAPLKELLS